MQTFRLFDKELYNKITEVAREQLKLLDQQMSLILKEQQPLKGITHDKNNI